MNADWITPDWPAPPWVGAVCTTRAGGVSKAPFDKLNLGDHVGDAEGDVAANRSNFARQIGAKPVFLNQVHGFEVAWLDNGAPHYEAADACVTRQPGVACTIMVADCLPVLMSTLDGSVVAAAHAGWRGLAGAQGNGVLEQTYESFRALALMGRPQTAINSVAWLGPCIGPSAFEVGAEVRSAFVDGDPLAAGCFTVLSPGKYLADLAGLARRRLQALGVTQIYGNDSSAPWCTVGNASRFFSHRRDAGINGNGLKTTGRMAACIWRE